VGRFFYFILQRKDSMKKARSWVVAASVLVLFTAVRASQETETEPSKSRHRFLNLSLFYPLSTNSSKQDTADVNLTLLYGRMGSVRGLDLARGVTGLEGSFKGIQLAGLLGAVGEQGEGIQLAGLASVSGEKYTGLQAAGLFCVAGDRLEGVQLSGLFSVAGETASGIQASGLFSVTGETLDGFQASGLFNVAGENLKGVQIAGLFNVAGEKSTALQLSGLMNVTGELCRGVQIGLFNVSSHLEGLQIGLVNVASTLDGVPVGLVNLTRPEDRRVRLATWLGSVSLINAGVKIWAKRYYSILYTGMVNMTQEAGSCLAYGFQYGYGVPLRGKGTGAGRNLRLEVDAGYVYLDNSTLFRHYEGTPDRHVLSIRGALATEMSSGVSVFAGTGLKYTILYGSPFGSGSVAPIIFAGIELF
jgi:hypothetical protein